MSDVRFSDIRHVADLASVFGTTVEAIRQFSDPATKAPHYSALRLPKKGKRRQGQFRTVYKVAQDLKLLQSNIATAIAAATHFADHVQGFVDDRSIATNARVHLGQRVLLHADIHHFFETITLAQVDSAFTSLGCVPEVAATLARICTFNDRLPEGSSASPIIANIATRYLDADLGSLASANGCRYTRYADDITISGDVVPDDARVEALLRQHGFQLRDGKCRRQWRGKSQYVTGLTVVDRNSPRIPRIAKRRLRLELYYATKFGLDSHMDRTQSSRTYGQEIKRLGGWISFMSSVEGFEATESLYRQWRALSTMGNPNGADTGA
jgi:nitrite reductase/ring-hydroxylating ferredoxin subunit